MQQKELIPHLFRTEFSKIAAVLSKTFGIDHIEVAEDIASETFLSALETWTYRGIPENPTAWLYTVAKNKTKNYLARNKVFTEKIAPQLKHSSSEKEELEIDLSEKNINDSQLQMLFALCHPSIPQEAQIGLALRILCGFGIDEIAIAFLTNKETINKRLFRAKEKLRDEQISIEYPGDGEISKRIETVLRTLYLLYSEGYYSESKDTILQEDLCAEAMRLTLLLIDNGLTNLPEVNALYALMCFHSSRFPARKPAWVPSPKALAGGDRQAGNENGEIILYTDQDESLWDQSLIEKGAFFLHKASRGDQVSKYHLEAGIAYWHTIKADTKEKWENILQLYNRLLQVEYSPVAALNRTYALSKANGKEEAIIEAEKLRLTDNHFYFTLLGELYSGIDNSKARENFEKAIALAKTQTDKHTIRKKIEKLNES
jgi:RNA polymerase sigma factor (sigma-70 family)